MNVNGPYARTYAYVQKGCMCQVPCTHWDVSKQMLHALLTCHDNMWASIEVFLIIVRLLHTESCLNTPKMTLFIKHVWSWKCLSFRSALPADQCPPVHVIQWQSQLHTHNHITLCARYYWSNGSWYFANWQITHFSSQYRETKLHFVITGHFLSKWRHNILLSTILTLLGLTGFLVQFYCKCGKPPNQLNL